MFSGHYVYPRTETVRAHALRSHQLFNIADIANLNKYSNTMARFSVMWQNKISNAQKENCYTLYRMALMGYSIL